MGLTNIDKQKDHSEDKQVKEANSKMPASQIQNDLKYNSPETDKNSKRQPKRSMSHNAPENLGSTQPQNYFALNGVVLPAYGDGKFY